MLSLLSGFLVLGLSACSEREITPGDVSKNLTLSGSWRTTATWDFLMPGSKTRFNGIAWYDQGGANFIYQDHGFGGNTFMRVIDGLVDAPGDPTPMLGVPLTATEGRKRVQSDLFSLDPLERAQLAGIKLKPSRSFELFGSVKCIKEPLADAICVDIDLTVKFNNKGYPLEVIYNASRKDKSSTQIVYGYQDFGKVNVKIISNNMNFDKMKPPVYSIPTEVK